MPEQRLYESIRPITLFGIPPAERAQETGLAESTLRRTADTFDALGMAGLFRPTKQQREDHHRSRPLPMRQLIVDVKAEYPDFSLREIAEICSVQFERRPSHNTVKEVLADGPPPSPYTCRGVGMGDGKNAHPGTIAPHLLCHTRISRSLDRFGYARFRRWRLYAEVVMIALRGERLEVAIGSKSSIVDQQVYHEATLLDLALDLTDGIFLAQVSGDDFGTNAVPLGKFGRQGAQAFLRARDEYHGHATLGQGIGKVRPIPEDAPVMRAVLPW